MRERQPGERLRVVIAGNIYTKRALVRRFLEDDGFAVVAEAPTRSELFALSGLADADAVVVDGDLLGGSLDELRGRAPDAAVVVFTGRAVAASPAGADAYLEKGMGLASLTALLHSLLTEAPATPLGLAWTEPAAQRQDRRILSGLAGVAAGTVLIAVVALAVFGTGTAPVAREVAEPTTPPAPSIAPPVSDDALDAATADLRALAAALTAGRPIGGILQRLDAELAAVRDAGQLPAFGNVAGELLQPLVRSLGQSLIGELRGVLGDFLDLSVGGSGGVSTNEGIRSGGGTDGVTTTSTSGGGGRDATGGSTDGGSGPATGGGDAGGGDTTGGGGGGGTTGGGGGSGGGDTTGGGAVGGSSNGNGHHYGWAHKPPDGGWHGTNPHAHGNARGKGRS